jgi:catechol 2,3-dioxygenase-like lactoylglutathione lyase family enzyme
MKLTLHHLNLSTTNVPAMDAFYRGVLDMQIEPALSANRNLDEGYSGKVSFVTDGQTQVHLSEKDLNINFRTRQAVNPLERGHIAFRTDDIAAFKQRLEAKGIPYSDFGTWAMKDWEQVFFYDPDGNVIEVHQVRPERG